jgi:glycosyltransferase involved in cell wall biosynthesis
MVMPSIPYPESGAEQSDRASGIRQLSRLGYEVKVLAKATIRQTTEVAETAARAFGVPIRSAPYVYSNTVLDRTARTKKFFRKLANPAFLDGAALEYAEPGIQALLEEELGTWKPDLVWFEYTYLWPLYPLVRKHGVPIVTRSLNFEPKHFLEEDGATFLNKLRATPKYASERRSIRWSDAVFAITPNEEAIYRPDAKVVATLPLRGLPAFFGRQHAIREQKPLRVFFMGSTYNVSHNREALAFLAKEVLPQANTRFPRAFSFHILGGKVPEDIAATLRGSATVHGYVDDLDSMLETMDVALIPSLSGAGMQQKIFEPLCRGIPTIASPRGIAGYPFKAGKHYLGASSAAEFVAALAALRDPKIRQRLGAAARNLSRQLFAENVLDATVQGVLQELKKGRS